MCGWIVSLRLGLGTNCGGCSVWTAPPSLGGHMNYLYGISSERDGTTAITPGDERIRPG
jgi:hypothetical protein